MTKYLSSAGIGERWNVHRAIAVRTMKRFGFGGIKLGHSKKSNRRYFEADVRRVEAQAGYTAGRAAATSSANATL